MDNGSLLASWLLAPVILVVVTLGLIAVITAVLGLNFIIGQLVDGAITLVRRRRRRNSEEPAPADAEKGSP